MKKIFFLTILLFAALFSFADYTGTVTTSQSDLSFSTNNGYNVVSLKNGFYTEEIGAPQLPVKILSFLIPADKKVGSITINSTTIQQLSGTYNIYPAQTPIPTNMSPNLMDFDDPNSDIYNSNDPYPGERFEITEDGYPMGYHVVTIKFYPVEYIPASKILKLYTSINFTIVYENNTEDVLLPDRQSKYSNDLSKGYIKNMVENPRDLSFVTGGAREVVSNGTATSNIKGIPPASLTIPDYIIITSSDLASSFQPLADWKTQKGVYSLIVTTEDIYSNYSGYDNAEKIRNYLKDVYVNFGSSYVLLGGDIDIVPTRFTPIGSDIFETNFYYATVQGNWNADRDTIFGENLDYPCLLPVFYVGRAPIHNTEEVAHFINKIKKYETLDSTSNKNYVKNLSFWAGDNWDFVSPPNQGGHCTYQFRPYETLDIIDDPSNGGYLDPAYFHVLKLYDAYHYSVPHGNAQINYENVMHSMNTGWEHFGQEYGNIHLIFHEDHSGNGSMGTSDCYLDQHISIEDVNSLTNMTNGKYYPQILYSEGCNANRFSLDAISEHFINNPNGGGVAFIGNSSEGSWGGESYFKNFFCKALYDMTKPDPWENINYHIGYANQYSAVTAQRLKNRNLLGDPEMMVWTDAPQNLTVSNLNYSSANKQIIGTISGLTFTATSQVIVTVCVWKGNEIYSTKDIAATTASISFTFDNILADTPGNIIVTVIAHNYVPKVDTINVPSITGAHPYMTSYTINDSGANGNNDQQADAGETIALPVTLTNSGNTSASNVTATLSWTAKKYQTQTGTNATITISTASSNFGTIAAGGTGNNNSSPFIFTINKKAFDIDNIPRLLAQYINFTLKIYVNGVENSSKLVELQIIEPNIVKGESSVTGTLAANSSNQLTIRLYNNGLSQVTGLTAILSTKDPLNITITNGSSTYPNINGVNTTTSSCINTSTFNFNVGSNGYTNNEKFDLTVTNVHGKIWNFNDFILSKQLIVNASNSKINHIGHLKSINLDWEVSLTTSVSIKGYNLYRSTSQDGSYAKVNNQLINYKAYIDEGLQSLAGYYYKLTAVDANGNESDYYPSSGYFAFTFPESHTGWPITPTSSINLGNRADGSPTVWDVDGDGKKEIFFTTGSADNIYGGVWAFKEDGSRWFSIDPNNIGGFINLGCYNIATPALGDMDDDGIAEMGITTNNVPNSPNSQKFLVYEPTVDINPEDQLPDMKYSIPVGENIVKGNVFSDINNDGKLESLLATQLGGVKIYTYNGLPYSNWTNTTGYVCGYSMPVAFDFDNNNEKEIIFGTSASVDPNFSKAAGIYIFKEDGSNYNSTNPVYIAPSGWRTDFPPVIADLDNDGTFEIIFICAKDKEAHIYAMKPDGAFLNGWNPNGSYPSFTLHYSVSDDLFSAQYCPSFSIGDIDKDGFSEVVCGDSGHLYVWNKNGGNYIVNIPIDNYFPQSENAPIIADIDNDNSDLEIIVTNTIIGNNAYAFKIKEENGSYTVQSILNFHISTDKIYNTPCVDDINNDGKNELIITTPTKFYVWNTQGDASNNIYGWLCYRHDAQNTGVYINKCQFSSSLYEIGSSYPAITTWYDDKTLNQSIDIKPNKTLVIKGTVKLQKDCKIIVEPGAKLTLDGCQLTNSECSNDLWQGIEVWGNSNQSQLPNSNQGIVELINGATIENAQVAIKAYKPNPSGTSGSYIAGYNGGIIHATGAIFKNNKTAIEYMPYSYTNHGYFTQCNFITDNALNGTNNPDYFVKFNGINGISIKGCSFLNTRPDNACSVQNRGSGIYGSNSSFRVDEQCLDNSTPCNNSQRSVFGRLYYGIYGFYGIGTIAGGVISIDNSNINCQRGIYLSSSTGAEVLSNNITTTDAGSGTGLPEDTYGLYLNGSTGYHVEANAFARTLAGYPNYGIIVNNSGTVNNSIYNNTFSGLSKGIQSQGINRGGTSTGLCITCNDFTNCTYDINVQGTVSTNGIAYYQGTASSPAGNTFSTSATYSIYSGPNSIIYYHHRKASTPLKVVPSPVFNVSNSNTSYNYVKVTSCPSLINNGGSTDNLSLMNAAENNAATTETQLTTLVDGGNTAALTTEVATSTPSEAIETRDELLTVSPYLSNDVMKTAVEKEDVLTNAMIRDVLVANPQSAKSDQVLEAVDNRVNPMPDYMIDQILEGQNTTGAKENLEAQLSVWQHERNRAFFNLYRNYASPETSDSLMLLLDGEPSLEARYIKAEAFVAKGEIGNAITVLNAIPSDFTLNDAQLSEYNAWIDYAGILQTIATRGGNTLWPDSTETNSLMTLAQNDNLVAGAYARDLLIAAGKLAYEEPILNDDGLKTEIARKEHKGLSATEKTLNLFPNPAKHYVTIAYSLEEEPANATIMMTDATGRMVKQLQISAKKDQVILPLSDMQPGTYIIQLFLSNKAIASEKLSIAQ